MAVEASGDEQVVLGKMASAIEMRFANLVISIFTLLYYERILLQWIWAGIKK